MAENSELTTAAVSKEVAKFEAVASQIEAISGGEVQGKDAMLLSSMFFSGYFKDIESLSKAVVRVAFGKLIGVPVATAVTSLYIIDGKPALEAKAIRNTLVMAGYTIDNTTPPEDVYKFCTLKWYYKEKYLGESTFSIEDAIARGYVDPTCVKVDGFPHKHNDREIERYNKYKRTYEKKTTCECKDNWRAMLEEMLIARATSKGNTKFGNRAFKQEVYEVSELTESPFREDTTVEDVNRDAINKAKTLDELQEITKGLKPEDLTKLMDDISAKTKELLSDAKAKTDNSQRDTTA